MAAKSQYVLSLNAGSSSLKFDLFEFPAARRLASGLVERVGSDRSEIRIRYENGETETRRSRLKDHKSAVLSVADRLHEHSGVPVGSHEDVAVIGHRIVHGSDKYTDPVEITGEVEADIERFCPLAPLHQPAGLSVVRVARAVWPQARHVACFDTAFHSRLPPASRYYAIPLELALKYGVRRFGFHGLSHSYLAAEAARVLGRPLARLKLITCHLGAGCSVTAIRNGRSIDTTMGYSPLEGLPMQTRAGDIDPAAVARIAEIRRVTVEEAVRFLNMQCGFRGVSATSGDMRDILDHRRKAHEPSIIAVEMFTSRVRKAIGAYAALLGGLDAVVFSAGIGENSPEIRSEICDGLEFLGIGISGGRNRRVTGPTAPHDISTDHARVRTLVIPTDEERFIARQAYELAG